jgi:hypothetical protein
VPKTFGIIDEEALCELIVSAHRRLVFVAPGVNEKTAAALADRMADLPPGAVQVVLDVAAEVCRLGYGTIEGLEAVSRACKQAGLVLHQQPGIRVGLVVADDRTVVYAPTPLLIEAGSHVADKPNAICLDAAGGIENVVKACVGGGPGEKEIGRCSANEEQMEAVRESLRQIPPKRFDIARAERVFSSRIQYVEFSFEDYKLSIKTVPIPSDLIGLAKKDDLAQRWRNSFRLFGDGGSFQTEIEEDEEVIVLTERALEDEKKAIVREFLFNLPKFGWVLNLALKQKFDVRVARFIAHVEAYATAVHKELQKHLETTRDRLIEILLPRVKENPPPRLEKTLLWGVPDDGQVRSFLQAELDKTFGAPEQVFNPTIKVVFKNVAYDSFSDPDFVARLEEHFGEGAVAKVLNEHDAAPEQRQLRFDM